jgi:hypothetical protein
MHVVQLNSQYCEQHTSPSNKDKPAPPAGPEGTETKEREGETAMKTLTIMVEWSAIAVALYATLALALPVEAFAGIA